LSNALERGLDVLEYLAAHPSARVSEVVTALEVSRATAFRLMTVLEARGYVEHVRGEHGWRLGPGVSALASSVDASSLVQLANPALEQLHQETGETINLAVLQRNRIIWASWREGSYALRLSTTVGEAAPAHATAVGKAILSVMAESEWARLLPPEPFPQVTTHTHRRLSELRVDIEAAQRRGWATDVEESELSGVCVAAPILGHDDRPVGAISISSVAGRMPAELRPLRGEAVAKWCDQISAQLRPSARAS
jgi:IclR family acetate operon transcriptional repressor